jgi:hypothetical protein
VIDPEIRRSCQETGTQLAGSWRGTIGSANAVQPIRTDLVVMLKWAHCPWFFESPGAAPAWPVAMAAQPTKQEEVGRMCPCLVGKISQLIGA